jgi:hypothetical protein
MRRPTRAAGLAIVGLLLLASCASEAGRPVRDINAGRHPNLAAAQDFCQRAFDKVSAAQEANEWDMGGHAQHAKELIGEASVELKAAAESANHRH